MSVSVEQLCERLEKELNEQELVTITAGQARAFINGDPIEELDSALDWAQGAIRNGETGTRYILIKIS